MERWLDMNDLAAWFDISRCQLERYKKLLPTPDAISGTNRRHSKKLWKEESLKESIWFELKQLFQSRKKYRAKKCV